MKVNNLLAESIAKVTEGISLLSDFIDQTKKETKEKTTTWVMPDGSERHLRVSLAAILESFEDVTDIIIDHEFSKNEFAEIVSYLNKVIIAVLSKDNK